MRNLYYNIWVDTIVNIKKNPQRKSDWKFYSMFFMTILTSLNLITVLMWLGFLGLKTNFLKINVFPGTMLDSFAMYLIQFGLPCFLLNYFFVFYKDKYKKLIEEHTDRKGKLFLIYLFGTIGVFIIPVLFYWWLY
jgi:hypothetical protein